MQWPFQSWRGTRNAERAWQKPIHAQRLPAAAGGDRHRSGSHAPFFGPSPPSPRTSAGSAPRWRFAGRRASERHAASATSSAAARPLVRPRAAGRDRHLALGPRAPRAARAWLGLERRPADAVRRRPARRGFRRRRVRRSGPWRLDRTVRLAAGVRRRPRPRRALGLPGRRSSATLWARRPARSRCAPASAGARPSSSRRRPIPPRSRGVTRAGCGCPAKRPP